MSLINSAITFVFLALFAVVALGQGDTTTARPSFPKEIDRTNGTGKGVDHCKFCGYYTDTDLSALTISRCTVEQEEGKPVDANTLFRCECREDFEGDGYKCNDRDECKDNLDNCDNNAHCNNTVPGWSCECYKGYRSTGENPGVTCVEIDECKEDVNKTLCSGAGTCLNFDGSYTCDCGDGYELNAEGTTCVDTNECQNDTICEQQCVNTVGSYSCGCYPGYEEVNGKCTSINECERTSNPCGYNAHCVDTDSGYYCACDGGFKWDPEDLFNRHCIDIDECKEKSHDCSGHSHTVCHNTYGSVDCVCEAGWTGEKENCMDVNECTLGIDHCHYNATCHNSDGTYDCTCKAGYTGTGFVCSDINECLKDETNDCDENAQCLDIVGGYLCECIYGYTGDGKTCDETGKNLDAESHRIAKSRLMIQVHLLDHDRRELEVEHERLLRQCAKQTAQQVKTRNRREVLDITDEAADQAESWIVTLKKINADLELANHALKISCDIK